jgi:hypothetical protein
MASKKGGMLLTGAPGTVKSLAARYIARRIYDDGGLVSYECKTEPLVLPLGSSSVPRMKEFGVDKSGASLLPRDDTDLYDELLSVASLVQIWDPPSAAHKRVYASLWATAPCICFRV